ncbi:39S ribosomal protein L40, mitochondrial [Teleopsis dalmanni]|uniref:39S ribosomal protein L40, mitochondrial n=1 Tax=Teleopsis dalmanni TaxID=139649 RepID=UPI0018CD1E3A|nr:39S ribosomal protein L40, mitochondrial [Teleopsis dalmanni]
MSFLRAFTRLSLDTPRRLLHTTPVLCAEPLKKKKKVDPAVVKAREERRRKRLEKQIRRLEKNARQLKPVDELEVPMDLIEEKPKRLRKLPAISAEVLEQRVLLTKQWSQYKHKEKVNDYQIIDRLLQSQNKALEELRLESEDLYQEAIQMDLQLMPITVKGPVATPPIEGYASPDGDYLHDTKKWS